MAMNGMLSTQWHGRLHDPDPALMRVLREAYSLEQRIVAARLPLLREVAGRFVEIFGERPMRLFRCPGRINLRGMHVDTHGGYLNVMTHQREVVVAVSPETDGWVTCANIGPQFEDVSFAISGSVPRGPWLDFVMQPSIRAEVEARPGFWGHYVKGCVLSVQHRFPETPLRGMKAVVGSDLPRGAALSSSAALCLATILGILGVNNLALDETALITAARDAEWFTGSRCGLSDQAAMVLGRRGQLINVALHAPALDVSSARRIPFPDAASVLVINSFTERSLSGSARVAYIRNRFAYSLALEILRQEMRRHHAPDDLIQRMDRLSNVTPPAFSPIGGMQTLLTFLKSIPETIAIAELRDRYDLPNLDEAYVQCFGGVPEPERPTSIYLRGPLLFGIAESERARLFPDAIESGDYNQAGMLMTCGHDGDRCFGPDGAPFTYDVSDEHLDRELRTRGVHIERFPGAYGASSAALDRLVDATLAAGACGASLTGAGIAGSVLALCRAEQAEQVADAVRAELASEAYARAAHLARPLSAGQLQQAVVLNTATAAAGELHQ